MWREKWVYGVARLLCKSWDCPVCGPKKAYRLRRAIEEWAREYDLSRFLTLTLDQRKLPENVSSEKYIRAVWSKFRVYLKRLAGESIDFISVLEFHKTGIAHLHVLISKYIPQVWISRSWDGLGGGRIVHIEKVAEMDKIGWYLGKYLTKEGILSAPRGVRRYTTSRKIKLLKRYVHTGQMELFDSRDKLGWWKAKEAIEVYYKAVGRHVLSERMDEADGSIQYFVTPINVEEAYEESRYVYPSIK